MQGLEQLRRRVCELAALATATAAAAGGLGLGDTAERVQSLANITERQAQQALLDADALVEAHAPRPLKSTG